MTRINLLPWRDLRRKEREREFYSIAAGAVIFMLLVILYIHFHMVGVIETQNGRNAFLEGEIKKVEGKIKEIKNLEEEKNKLLARMRVIEALQLQRPQMVHVFDELVQALPDGVYLTSFKQNGTAITLEGIAQSNARVSAFMRNIDASHWLTEPKLNVIQATDDKGGQKGNKFILDIKQVVEGEIPDAGPGAKTAAKVPPRTGIPKTALPKTGKAGKP